MRTALRLIFTFLGLVLGAGTLSPLVQANWQAWAQKTGNDQYLIQYADLAMSTLGELAHTPWFIFSAGFFVGGAICLWLDYLIRHSVTAPVNATNVTRVSAGTLAHALHLVDSTGVHVGVDKTKKSIQIGFNLKNSSTMPLRYSVKEATSIVDGHASMAQNFTNRGGVVALGGTTRFLCVPIPYTLSKKGAEATASIVYQYGPAGPSELPAREAIYRVEISIGPTGSSAYVIQEENDAEI